MNSVVINVTQIVRTVEVNATPNLITITVNSSSGGGTGAVSSVFGRSGAVSAQSGDYNAEHISETSARVFVSPAEKADIPHTNRSVLDLITEAFTTTLKNLYDAASATIASHISNTGNPHNTTASQVGAYTASQVDAIAGGLVPTTRTVNGKALSANITLSASDVPESADKRYQTDAQRTNNDATSSIQGQLNSKQDKMSWISSSTPFTGTSSTTLQKLSNTGSSGNGSFPAKANTRYKIEVQFQLSGLSSTTNVVQFGILGTVGIASVSGQSMACKSATLISSNTPSYTALNTATISAALMTTGTQAFARATIILEVVTSTAGNLIIAFATNVSTTPVVENHLIRFIELGTSSQTSSSDIV